MMKRIGRGFKRDKSSLLEGLFTRELTHTQSYSNMSTSSKFKISKVVIKYTKLQNYASYSLSVELINSCTIQHQNLCSLSLVSRGFPIQYVRKILLGYLAKHISGC